MFREAFIKIKEELGITGRALSKQSGIDESRISEYINGKRDISTEILWELLQGLEALSPGAIRLYYSVLAHSLNASQDLAVQLVNIAMAVRDLETKNQEI